MWHVGFNGDITSWIHIVDINMRVSKTFDVLWSIPAKRLKWVFSNSIFVFGKNSLVSTGKPKMEDKNSNLIWVVVSNIFYFHPYLGKIPNLTNIFQRGWNHQLVIFGAKIFATVFFCFGFQ